LFDFENCAQAIATKKTHAKPNGEKQILCSRKLPNLDAPAPLPFQKISGLSLSFGNSLGSGEGNCEEFQGIERICIKWNKETRRTYA